jgi:hypothetical protein
MVLGQDKKPKVGGGASVIGTGRDQLAEALEDRFGHAGRLVNLAWFADGIVLQIRILSADDTQPEGWRKMPFTQGPGGFATRAMRWLAALRADSWQSSFSDSRPDEVKITPL